MLYPTYCFVQRTFKIIKNEDKTKDFSLINKKFLRA